MTMFPLFDDIPQYSTATFPTPRPFQDEAHEALRNGARNGHRCQMLMAPTGSGKTFLGLRAIHEALQKGKRAMFICDRRTLIEQTSAVSDRYGLTAHSVMMADHWKYDRHSPFQIASAQTLARRQWPDVDLIVVDEAHVQMAVWVEKIKTCKAHVIGLSATPFSDGLGKLFSNLVCASSMHALTESGVLVPMRVFSCTRVDMKGAATAGGEWTDGAAAERGMEIIGDVVHEWKRFASYRKTIVFGATIKHCEEMARQFNESGVMAACFTSDTDQSEREMLLAEYRKPNSALRVLLSVNALAKGFDVPDVGCVCDVRPLRKSLSEAIQMWGRGLRSSPETGKKDCVARDTLILTDKGEVKIQHVTLDHKVWDGLNFVDHCGAICRGVRPVIHYDGLTATHDHEVMTDDGWKRFEDAARWKQRIAVTGIGGTPIRFGKDSFSKDRGQRRESKGRGNLHSMLALLDGFCQQYLEQAGNSGLPKLQWSQAGKGSKMAVSSLPRMVSALRKSAVTVLRAIRSARDSVSFSWRERGCAVGIGYARSSGSKPGNRQDRQQWALRAWKSSVGNISCEHEQYEGFSWKEPVYCVSEELSGSDVRRRNPKQTHSYDDGRGNNRALEVPVFQAEREVWDILNAGPLQRFTAGGRLVHNCILLDFSGNIVRFADDFSGIYYHGLEALDMGEKLDKTIRRDDEEKPEGKACPECGYKPCGKRCVSCGYEHQVAALVEHEAGTMQEITFGGKKYADDKRHLWEQAVSYARGFSVPEKQLGRARHIYKDISGEWPDHTWSIANTPSVPITRAVFNKIKANNIRWAKSREAIAA